MSSDDVRALFTKLEPPPGGVERFAARLASETVAAPSNGRRGRGLAAAAACAAIALAAAVWLRERNGSGPAPEVTGLPTVDLYNAPELDRLLGRPLQAAELTVRLGAEPLPVTQLETANEKIRIYSIERPGAADAP